MVDYREDPEYKTKIEKREDVTSSFFSSKKHYVRMNGWFNVARIRKESTTSRNETDGYVRYFTLCGREAMDVLLFEREDIIRANNRGYPDVCYCDYSVVAPLEFAKLKEALGRTKGFNMRFQDLVDDADFVQLVSKEPFDIINLDFCGSCFPNYDAPDSATLRSIRRTLELQSNVSFDLFVTFRAQRSLDNLSAIQELNASMTQNFNDFNEIRETWDNNIGQQLNELSESDYPNFLLSTIPKIILGFGSNFDLNGNCSNRFYYQRRGGQYKIIKFIFSFNPMPDENGLFSRTSRRSIEVTNNYREAITRYLGTTPINVDSILNGDSNLRQELDADQSDLINNRKKFQI